MSTITYTVRITDPRMHRPIAVHGGLTWREAMDLASVYRDGLGYPGEHVAIDKDPGEQVA